MYTLTVPLSVFSSPLDSCQTAPPCPPPKEWKIALPEIAQIIALQWIFSLLGCSLYLFAPSSLLFHAKACSLWPWFRKRWSCDNSLLVLQKANFIPQPKSAPQKLQQLFLQRSAAANIPVRRSDRFPECWARCWEEVWSAEHSTTRANRKMWRLCCSFLLRAFKRGGCYSCLGASRGSAGSLLNDVSHLCG